VTFAASPRFASPLLARVTRSPLAGASDGPTLSAYRAIHPRSGSPMRPGCAGGLRMTRDDERSERAFSDTIGPGAPGDDVGGGGRGSGFAHTPVMLAEVLDLLVGTPGGVFVDATVGGAGHASALLAASPYHRLVALDQDTEAVETARARLAPFGARAVVVHGRFDRLAAALAEAAPGEPVSGVLFDLGVSSWQLDEAERGFSYRYDAPLDMRMDRSSGITAAELLDELTEEALAALLVDNGESRFARRLARAILSHRPVTTTQQLVDIVLAALPAAARRHGGHPAKRVFQALRIAVNEELDVLGPALDTAMSLLTPGGRLVVLSYHSGEDRIVKQRLVGAASGWCTCPPGLPCVCGAIPAVRLLNRGARLVGREEKLANPRAASARLRAAERLDSPFRRPGEAHEDPEREDPEHEDREHEDADQDAEGET
jgi:16S rRNA (cytosine1402-N4)-methyltransferase